MKREEMGMRPCNTVINQSLYTPHSRTIPLFWSYIFALQHVQYSHIRSRLRLGSAVLTSHSTSTSSSVSVRPALRRRGLVRTLSTRSSRTHTPRSLCHVLTPALRLSSRLAAARPLLLPSTIILCLGSHQPVLDLVPSLFHLPPLLELLLRLNVL